MAAKKAKKKPVKKAAMKEAPKKNIIKSKHVCEFC